MFRRGVYGSSPLQRYAWRSQSSYIRKRRQQDHAYCIAIGKNNLLMAGDIPEKFIGQQMEAGIRFSISISAENLSFCIFYYSK